MKITKSQLRKVIKEEISKVLEYVGPDYSPKIFGKESKKRDINAPKNTPQEALQGVAKFIEDSQYLNHAWTKKAEALADEGDDLTHKQVNALYSQASEHQAQEMQYEIFYS
jgi:hypothetical protein